MDASRPVSAVSGDPRVLLVRNPRTCGARETVARLALEALRHATRVEAEIETRGDGGDGRRLAEAIAGARPAVVVAAGGDGTVGLVTAGLVASADAETQPALGILPLGTGNNAARSFGLRSLRRARDCELAVGAIAAGVRRAIDVGTADDRPFLGSFALGLDAEILRLRNRLQGRLGRPGGGGYGLYLLAFAARFAASPPRFRADLRLDGVATTRRLCNLVVTNAPVYAGPLRFDARADGADGRLDLHPMPGARAYLSEYPRAWVRYLRVQRDMPCAASPLLRRAREIDVALERPVPALLDGEELAPVSAARLRVLVRAIRLCMPTPPVPSAAR
jgi:diacylglycerol kinase (ATP)